MRARKIGRWVGCAVIGGVIAVGAIVGISAANAEVVWERSKPSAPVEKVHPKAPEWVPAVPDANPPASDVAPSTAN
jgi:hypothetical protein